MKVYDLLICDDLTYLKKKDIIIYGTGFWGKKVYEVLKKYGAHIRGVCTTEGRERLFCNTPVLTIRQVKERFDESSVLLVIASIDFYREMIENCEKQSFLHAKICTLYAVFQSFFLHCADSSIPEALRMEIDHNLRVSETRTEYYTKFYAFDMMLRAVEEGSVLVYQPGKVGSQSIWKSIGGSSVQFHSLAIPFGCREFSKEPLDYYLQKVRNKKIKIIAGVREPIARDLAAMFQNSEIDLWPFNSANSNIFWWYGDFIGNEKRELSHSEIMRRSPRWKGTLQESFFRLSESIMEYKLDEFSWFQYELDRVFGVDIFQEPFDKKKGFTIIKKDNVEIFIYKLEMLRGLDKELGGFLDREDYKLMDTNLSENKIYYYAYRELRKTIKLSREYFAYYYAGNQAYRHFYTDEEIDVYKKCWKGHVNE